MILFRTGSDFKYSESRRIHSNGHEGYPSCPFFCVQVSACLGFIHSKLRGIQNGKERSKLRGI
jgi:hypothetical protein